MSTPISLTNLTTPLTSAQIRGTMVTALVQLGIRADLWIAGGVASSILTVAANVLAIASSLIALTISGFFLPLATGTGLQLLALYMYGVAAPTATFATGNVTLTNSGGGVYPIAVGGYTCLNTTTGQTYTNTQAFTLGALATLTIPIACTAQGSIGNAAPGQINANVTSLLGVTVTNGAAVVGLDAIGDVALRQLCLNSLGARSVRGVRSAYAYAVQTAMNSVTGQPVNINRFSITESSHTGTVTIYVAAPSGIPSANDVAGVVTNIEAVARPNAVAVTVAPCVTANYSNIITVWCQVPNGTATATIANAISAALVTFFQNYPIGGLTATDDSGTITGLFASGIVGVIGQAVAISNGQLISVKGATDLALGANAVALNLTTINVQFVTAPTGTTVST